ncbi:MAG: AAA family ATPase [Nanoarchaeota archaeon]
MKFKKPEAVEKRLKMFVYGPAGIGKTVACLAFPDSAIIDTEKGTDFYADLINESNSLVLQTIDPEEIYDELNTLLTEKHDRKTLIIDPITQVYNAVQEKWTRIFEKHAKSAKEKEIQDFGMRYWGKVKGEFKALERMFMKLDMNVIVTAHQKDVYSTGFSKVGVTFDSMKGDDYLFDLVFRLVVRDGKRFAITEKERAIPGKQKFPPEFEWNYENFKKYYGAEIIEKEAVPVKMATKKQVEHLDNLIEALNVDEAQVAKWLSKVDCDQFSEMTEVQIKSLIEVLTKKIEKVKGAK